jgi:membrane-associated phospholipid phosphatase
LSQLKKPKIKSIIIIFSLIQVNLFSQNLDIDLLRHINVERNRSFDETFMVITNSVSVVSIGTPILLCGIGFINHDSTTIRKSLIIGTSVAVTAILSTITKYAVDRPRLYETYPFIEKESGGGSPSFPSGHTSQAFAMATSVSLNYPRWYVIAPFFLWAGAVGYSRMDLGVHYPSDVLTGAILGAGCAMLTFKVNLILNKKTGTHLKASSNN